MSMENPTPEIESKDLETRLEEGRRAYKLFLEESRILYQDTPKNRADWEDFYRHALQKMGVSPDDEAEFDFEYAKNNLPYLLKDIEDWGKVGVGRLLCPFDRFEGNDVEIFNNYEAYVDTAYGVPYPEPEQNPDHMEVASSEEYGKKIEEAANFVLESCEQMLPKMPSHELFSKHMYRENMEEALIANGFRPIAFSSRRLTDTISFDEMVGKSEDGTYLSVNNNGQTSHHTEKTIDHLLTYLRDRAGKNGYSFEDIE